jgi:hypothetical protein
MKTLLQVISLIESSLKATQALLQPTVPLDPASASSLGQFGLRSTGQLVLGQLRSSLVGLMVIGTLNPSTRETRWIRLIVRFLQHINQVLTIIEIDSRGALKSEFH